MVGALIMLGGDRSFDLGEYNNAPIADILPVQLGVAGGIVLCAALLNPS